jgi:hypothetical protein
LSGIDPELELHFVAQRQVEKTREDALSTIVIPAREVIRVAMAPVPTTMAPAGTRTVDGLEGLLQEADQFQDGVELTSNGALHDALRIFLCPEWYFRRDAPPLTHAEMRALIEQLKAVSALYPRWLIVPDTTGGAPNPATVQAAIVDCTRLTLDDAGADALPVRVEPGHPDAWFCINLAAVFYQGMVIHYVCKEHEQDIHVSRKDRDFWAMRVLPAATRAQVVRSPFFTLQNVGGNRTVRFALDVCRDHRMMRALQTHARTLPADAGVDIQIVIANQVEVEARQTCTHDFGLVLHCDGHGPATSVHRTARNVPPCRDVALMVEAQRLGEVDNGLDARLFELNARDLAAKNRLANLERDLRAELVTCDDLRKKILDAEIETRILGNLIENAQLAQWKEDLRFHEARVRMWDQVRPARRLDRRLTDEAFLALATVQQQGRQQMSTIDDLITNADASGLALDPSMVAGDGYVRWRAAFELDDVIDPGQVGPAPPNAVLPLAPAVTYRCVSCDTAHQPFFANACTNCGRAWLRDGKIMFYRSA